MVVAAAGFLPVCFTNVVPVDAPDVLLVLLTVLVSRKIGIFAAPRFGLVTAVFASGTFLPEVLRIAFFVGPDFSLSFTRFTRLAVAVKTPAFAGEANLACTTDLRGETGRERYDFCGDPICGRIGDCGSLHEFGDLGDKIVEEVS